MSNTEPNQVTDGKVSPLSAIPTAEAIRQRMQDNAAENRHLRSLYRLARRLDAARKQDNGAAKHE